jgi:SAM-dependent methyltransferase
MDGAAPGSEAEQGSPGWWNMRYLSGDIPWDTGIVPPEVEQLISLEAVRRGWALDLGCGSGLSSRYLARHGFRVVGVDLSLTALGRAFSAARAADATAYFCAGDVSDLAFLALRCTLALDIGCFHAISPAARPAYVSSLGRLLLPGAHYLLYSFEATPLAGQGPPGVSPRDVAAFAPRFALRWVKHGTDGERLAAWYLFQRV